jgi:hypothetical protein
MLDRELSNLKIESRDFKSVLQGLYEKYPDNKDEITAYTENLLESATKNLENNVNELSIKVQLIRNTEILPLAYIAKNYFHRTRTWLYQRINGNLVNGKPAKFTKEEKEVFNQALKDISNRIGSINIA